MRPKWAHSLYWLSEAKGRLPVLRASGTDLFTLGALVPSSFLNMILLLAA